MELKLTTLRALKFEEETGKDIVETVREIGETDKITVKDVVSLFKAMGDGYTVEKFDEWGASFSEKAKAVITEAARYISGRSHPKSSAVKRKN